MNASVRTWRILRALLVISLFFNIFLVVRFYNAVHWNPPVSVEILEAKTTSSVESALNSNLLPSTDWSNLDKGVPDPGSLIAAGLTPEESANILVSLINTRYEIERKELLTIGDPMLTADEIYAKGLKRFDQLREADQQRRDALEAVTGDSWARADFNVGWSKPGLLFLISGALTAPDKEKIPEINSVIIAALRDISFARSDPFGMKRSTHSPAVEKIYLRQKMKMKSFLSEEEFQEYFKPLVSMNVHDVFGMDDRFGRDLTEEENDKILSLLTPMHPLLLFDDSSGLSGKSLPEDFLTEIRVIVGDESFAHHLRIRSEMNWSPEVHLQVFEIEQQFKAEHEILSAPSDSPRRHLLNFHHESLATLLGDDLPKYMASERGAWLTPAVTAP